MMKRYAVNASIAGGKFLGYVLAKSANEAVELSGNLEGPKLCHQCVDQVEDPGIQWVVACNVDDYEDSATNEPSHDALTQRAPSDAKWIQIGVNDRNGRPICIGDVLMCEPTEWGGGHNITIELVGGEIRPRASTQDLSDWCVVTSSPGSSLDVRWSPWEPETARNPETKKPSGHK